MATTPLTNRPSQQSPVRALHWVVSGLLVGASAGFWLAVRHAFTLNVSETYGQPSTWLYGLFLLVLLGILLAFIVTVAILVSHRWVRLGVFAAASLCYLLAFGVSPLLLLGAALVFLGTAWFGKTVQSELRDRMTFSAIKLTRHDFGYVALVLILGVSLAQYTYAVRQGQEAFDAQVNTLTRTSTGVINQVLGSRISGYDPAMTMDAFIVRFTATDEAGQHVIDLNAVLRGIPRDAELQETLDREAAQLTDEVVGTLRMQLLQDLQIEASGTDTIETVVERVVRKQVVGLLGRVERFLPLVTAVGLFFLLEAFTVVYLAVGRLFTAFIFAVLFAMRLVRKERVAAQQDVLVSTR